MPAAVPEDGAGAGDGAGGGAQTPAAPEAAPVPDGDSDLAELLAWVRAPDAASRCSSSSASPARTTVPTLPGKPLIACDEDGIKYLMTPAVIEGTQLNDASSGIPQNDVQYVVNLDFDGEATDVFADVTRALVNTDDRFAIVLDGEVLSAPGVNSAIIDGNAQISGDFTQASAQSLANSLKYGALPLKFDDSVVSEEGPTLAAGPALRGPARRRHRPGAGADLLHALLPRPRHRGGRLAGGGRCADLRGGHLPVRDGRLHPHAARHRRSDRGGGYHRRLVHRLLRANT